MCITSQTIISRCSETGLTAISTVFARIIRGISIGAISTRLDALVILEIDLETGDTFASQTMIGRGVTS